MKPSLHPLCRDQGHIWKSVSVNHDMYELRACDRCGRVEFNEGAVWHFSQTVIPFEESTVKDEH